MFEDERIRDMYQMGIVQEKNRAELVRRKEMRQLIENNIRTAEMYICKAKNALSVYYDDYADIQGWMHEMELVRSKTETLMSKFLNDKLK